MKNLKTIFSLGLVSLVSGLLVSTSFANPAGATTSQTIEAESGTLAGGAQAVTCSFVPVEKMSA